MVRTIRAGALALFLATSWPATPTAAQAIYGAYETASDDVSIIFVGGNFPLNASIGSWTPYLTASAYRLNYELAGQDVDVNAFTPGVGLRRRFDGGSFAASLGYKFQSTDVDEPIPFFGGSDGGVSTSTALTLTGASPFVFEGLGSYNWGAEYLWTRARGLVGLGSERAFRVGGEVGWQGEMGDGDYSAVQYGPVVQASFGRFTVGARAGWKNDDGPETHTYFGVEAGVGLGR